jgi:hypothetical protein
MGFGEYWYQMNFQHFRNILISLGERVRKEVFNREEYEKELVTLNVIDRNFLKSQTHPSYQTGSDMEYLRGIKSIPHPRKPFPGFNPKAYAEDNKSNYEPTCDFIKKGRPAGRWNIKCINLVKQRSSRSEISAALHLHIFYADMAEEMALRIKQSERSIPLYISIGDKSIEQQVRSAFSAKQLHIARIAVVPNRGRDIGPFLTEFARELSKYEIIGHAHTKKSSLKLDPIFVKVWSEMLLENVLGGNTRALDIILKQFEDDPEVGLVFPSDPYITGWENNKKHIYKISSRLKINESELPDQFDYPVGNMFWARASAIKTALLAEFQWEDYPPEPLPYDGSDLHAMERLWPFIVSNQGYKILNTYHPEYKR